VASVKCGSLPHVRAPRRLRDPDHAVEPTIRMPDTGAAPSPKKRIPQAPELTDDVARELPDLARQASRRAELQALVHLLALGSLDVTYPLPERNALLLR